jgi:hypothetical protein
VLCFIFVSVAIMRLLNAKTLILREFFDTEMPTYVILSHRWEEEEVSYLDYSTNQNREGSGYNKIIRFCSLSADRGYEWVWVDTCCIDKRSSAELSEAINAMYKWYERAAVCIVYLSDVNGMDDFDQSKWFTRGWTLQELLAPRSLEFFNQAWVPLSTRDDLSMPISELTGIDAGTLRTPFRRRGERDRQFVIQSASVAKKMSWASRRRTSRAEDIAYCLLGLFHINMPLLYGEGAVAAFQRLQREILVTSDDESIFAWMTPRDLPYGGGILADSPRHFQGSNMIRRLDQSDHAHQALGRRKPYQITNKGLRMEVHLMKRPGLPSESDYSIPINCKMGRLLETEYPLLLEIRLNDSRHVLYQVFSQTYYRMRRPVKPTELEWKHMLSHPSNMAVECLEDYPLTEIYLDLSTQRTNP